MQIGRKILNLRLDRKLSQKKLAQACRMSSSALSKIESGITTPKASVIYRIARALGVSTDYLLEEKEPYPPPTLRFRSEVEDRGLNPQETVRAKLTREEDEFIKALREGDALYREAAYAIPSADTDTIRIVRFILCHEDVREKLYDVKEVVERLSHPAP